jgi:hypothetical protein
MRVNRANSVGMVPVRSLSSSRLRPPPSRLVITIVQRNMQGGGWQEAYKVYRFVNSPTFVVMVPVRSL